MSDHQDAIPLTDTSVSEVFCTNLARIEPIGSGACVRLVFAVPEEARYRVPPVIENMIVAKLVVPVEELAAIAAALLQRRAASVPKVDRVTLNS